VFEWVGVHLLPFQYDPENAKNCIYVIESCHAYSLGVSHIHEPTTSHVIYKLVVSHI